MFYPLHNYTIIIFLNYVMMIIIHLKLFFKVLSEAYRVLKPGGRFLCLEFSHVENDLLRW